MPRDGQYEVKCNGYMNFQHRYVPVGPSALKQELFHRKVDRRPRLIAQTQDSFDLVFRQASS